MRRAFIVSVNHKVETDREPVYKRWLKIDEHRYRFQSFYENAGRTPKCREGQSDWFISFEFSDNSTEGVIEYGYH